MIKKLNAFRRSLYAKMLAALVLGVLLAVLVFFGVNALGSLYVNNVYLSDRNVSARKAELCSSLSQYVIVNAVRGDDDAALGRWSSRNPYATVLVYKGLTLSTRVRGERSAGQDSLFAGKADIGSVYDSRYGRLYTVNFADGVYKVAILDNSSMKEEAVFRIISVAAAALVLIAVMFRFTWTLLRRIRELSVETAEVGAGNLQKEIGVDGTDEIASLGGEIDHMRRAVIARIESEQEAWQSNSDLITSISHDLRTPMTSLIGYLDLLESCDPNDTESVLRFTQSARRKGMELKSMTDELFRYFLIFGKSDVKPATERYDAPSLLEQLLGETAFDLMDNGYRVEFTGDVPPCSIDTDVAYLKRCIDNLLSNIKKYADIDLPVYINCSVTGSNAVIAFTNAISPDCSKKESTKIGLRSCKRMLELLGGSFRSEADVKSFSAVITHPVVLPAPNDASLPEETKPAEKKSRFRKK